MKEYYIKILRKDNKDKLFVENHYNPKSAATRVLWRLVHKKQSKLTLGEANNSLQKITCADVEKFKSMNYSVFEVRCRKKSSLIESYKVSYYLYKGII